MLLGPSHCFFTPFRLRKGVLGMHGLYFWKLGNLFPSPTSFLCFDVLAGWTGVGLGLRPLSCSVPWFPPRMTDLSTQHPRSPTCQGRGIRHLQSGVVTAFQVLITRGGLMSKKRQKVPRYPASSAAARGDCFLFSKG